MHGVHAGQDGNGELVPGLVEERREPVELAVADLGVLGKERRQDDGGQPGVLECDRATYW